MSETPQNSFYQLTPDTVLHAIEQSGFELTGHCLTLNSYENRVYDLTLEDGGHIVTKFYRPGRWSRAQIEEEHAFLAQLRELEIPACVPLTFDDGSTIHETGNIMFSVWPRTGGRAGDELSDSDLQILGHYLARLHNVGASRPAPHRIALTADHYAHQPLAFLREHKLLPPHCEERYATAVREIAELYTALSHDIPMHRIHGDCHLGNLLKGNEGWYFLDFDDFLTGPAVQDVWMLLPARDTEGLRQREVFLDAYRQFREFNPSWLRLIEPLRALRYIHYATWIARRWQDPAFPAAFPHFGTTTYWEEETRDLEEQLEYCHAHIDDIPESVRREEIAVPDEAELTNKDFFWDWEEK